MKTITKICLHISSLFDLIYYLIKYKCDLNAINEDLDHQAFKLKITKKS